MSRLRIEQMKILLLSHAKEILREPGVLFWGIVFPILMALGLGLAFTQSSEVVRSVAVISSTNESNQINSERRIDEFLADNTVRSETKSNEDQIYTLRVQEETSGKAEYIFRKTDWKRAYILLKRGEISVALDEKDGKIEYHFDKLNPDAQLTYLKLSRIFNEGSDQNALQEVNKNRESIVPLTLKGTRYIDFLVPGLIAMGIMMSSVWGLGYNLIEKRSKKLLRRMIATPMKKSYFLISFIIVRAVMSLIEGLLLFLVSWLVFGVTIQGSLVALLLIFIAANLAFAGIAILTSSRTASTEIGNGLINAVTTPMIVLSGVFFSYHNFPDWAVAVIRLLPLTTLADIMRSIFIEGAGVQDVILPFFIMLVIGAAFFAIGLKYFKWH